MSIQTDLFEPLPPFVEVEGAHTIQEHFKLFHEANPWVLRLLVTMARDWAEQGHSKVGIGMLFEVIRWQHGRQTQDPTSGWKLNNNYRSRYVRLIQELHPDLAGLFETRELKAA